MAAPWTSASTLPHPFEGSTDRWCERCNLPDRHSIHSVPIDWYTTMRDCVGGAAVLAGRIEHSDSDVGEALNRLCNVVAHLLDENKALAERVQDLETKQTGRRSAPMTTAGAPRRD